MHTPENPTTSAKRLKGVVKLNEAPNAHGSMIHLKFGISGGAPSCGAAPPRSQESLTSKEWSGHALLM